MKSVSRWNWLAAVALLMLGCSPAPDQTEGPAAAPEPEVSAPAEEPAAEPAPLPEVEPTPLPEPQPEQPVIKLQPGKKQPAPPAAPP